MEQDWDETESLLPVVSRLEQECDKTFTNFSRFFVFFWQDQAQDFWKDKQTDEAETESLGAFSFETEMRPWVSSLTATQGGLLWRWFH